jgi:hypothetical protein
MDHGWRHANGTMNDVPAVKLRNISANMMSVADVLAEVSDSTNRLELALPTPVDAARRSFGCAKTANPGRAAASW